MGQVVRMGLVWIYLGRVLAFTFRGSVKQTDSWQIIAGGTAIPSIALGIIYGLIGREMPSITPAQWAELFGYGLASWLAIRFLIAPFFIWRDQYQESAKLRLELSKPERIELERMSRLRAKQRIKLAMLVRLYYDNVADRDDVEIYLKRSIKLIRRITKQMGRSGMSYEAQRAVSVMFSLAPHRKTCAPELQKKFTEVAALIHLYLHGKASDAALMAILPSTNEVQRLQSLPDIEEETRL